MLIVDLQRVHLVAGGRCPAALCNRLSGCRARRRRHPLLARPHSCGESLAQTTVRRSPLRDSKTVPEKAGVIVLLLKTSLPYVIDPVLDNIEGLLKRVSSVTQLFKELFVTLHGAPYPSRLN